MSEKYSAILAPDPVALHCGPERGVDKMKQPHSLIANQDGALPFTQLLSHHSFASNRMSKH
jgi:hypothetical protein